MSEARDIMGNQGPERASVEPLREGNVVLLADWVPKERASPLSDGELGQIRAMLRGFGKIAESCPMARRLLEDKD